MGQSAVGIFADGAWELDFFGVVSATDIYCLCNIGIDGRIERLFKLWIGKIISFLIK